MELVAKIPLFDRLTGQLMGSKDGRNLQADGLNLSLCRDLERLFSSRNGLTISEFLNCAGGVMYYGTPDTLDLSPQSGRDIRLLEDVLRHAITLYEPRLLNATIVARPDENNKYGVNVQLKAAVRLGGQLRRVDFDLQMGADGVAMQPVELPSTKGEM